jgi:hypothetical protein
MENQIIECQSLQQTFVRIFLILIRIGIGLSIQNQLLQTVESI